MEGMSKQAPADLLPLAKSWLRPAEINPISDCRNAAYDPAQRAYVLVATGAAPRFGLAASPDHPLVNPAIVIRNWNADSIAEVAIDGVPQPDRRTIRQGVTCDPNGRAMLVVWVQLHSTVPTVFTFHGAHPANPPAGLPALAWAVAPQPGADAFSAEMQAAPLPEVGNEYLFDCVSGPGHSSGWIAQPDYLDANLPPEAKITYRVKARDVYQNEMVWSPIQMVRTLSAPPPVVWELNEGTGTNIHELTGRHGGTLVGAATWIDRDKGKALHLEGYGHVDIAHSDELHSNRSFTWAAWIRTTHDGTILARVGVGPHWQPGGKVMFIEHGRLRFDVGWVGVIGADRPVADGAWHHVAVTVAPAGNDDNVHCFVDGRLDGSGSLDVSGTPESGLPVRIGFCNHDFPRGQSAFVGDLADIRWFSYALTAEAIRELAEKAAK